MLSGFPEEDIVLELVIQQCNPQPYIASKQYDIAQSLTLT